MNVTELAEAFCALSLEMLVYDIQDVGVRFYTFIWTLYDAMLSATRCRTVRRFVVLDRPNPVGGTVIQGPVYIDDGLASLVGRKPIALQHGMTVGELSRLFAAHFLPTDPEADPSHAAAVAFDVIPLSGWDGRWPLAGPCPQPETALSAADEWVPPSPNIPTPASALAYVGLGLLEGVNVSVGRGTAMPFLMIGAPWVDGRLAEALRAGRGQGQGQGQEQRQAGVGADHAENGAEASILWREAYFEPQSDVYAGEVCGGVHVMRRDESGFAPLPAALRLLTELRRLYPNQFGWRTVGGGRYWLDYLTGSNYTRLAVDEGQTPDKIQAWWRKAGGLDDFLSVRERFLMYA